VSSWRLTISEDGPGGGDVEKAIAPYLRDPRVTYRANGERLGAAENKTTLIAGARARYVALLDDDDLWGPRFLERRLAFLESHRECAFAFSSMTVIDENGTQIGRWTIRLREGLQPSEEFVRQLISGNVVGASSVVVRRAAYEAVGPSFDGSLPRTYDYEMWFRLALRFKAGYVGGYDASWRVHRGQGTDDLDGLPEEYSALVDRIFRLVERERPGLRLDNRLRHRKLSSLLLSGALNGLERANRDVSRRCLATALRVSPASVVDPRVPLVGLGLVLGPLGPRAARWTRATAHDRGLRRRL
jgi:hypothetical protein